MTIPLVTVTCRAVNQSGSTVAGAIITACLNKTEKYNGQFVVANPVRVVADAVGIAVLDLFPNALGVNGSQYTFRGDDPATGNRFLDALVTVPNSNCNLDQILPQIPYPPVGEAQQAMEAAQAAAAVATAKAILATTQAGIATDAAIAAEISAVSALTRSQAAALSQFNANESANSAAADAATTSTKAAQAVASAAAAASSASSAGTSATTATQQSVIATNGAASASASAAVYTDFQVAFTAQAAALVQTQNIVAGLVAFA